MRWLHLLLVLCVGQAHYIKIDHNEFRASGFPRPPLPPPIEQLAPQQQLYAVSKELMPAELLVDLTNDLAFRILHYHSILNRNNFAYSPSALMSVLVALYEGSAGRSATELRNVLQLPATNVIRIGYRDIHRRLRTYFFGSDNPLRGLSLNKDNVTITRDYEAILTFYGYDLGMDMVSSTAAPTTTSSTSSSAAPSTSTSTSSSSSSTSQSTTAASSTTSTTASTTTTTTTTEAPATTIKSTETTTTPTEPTTTTSIETSARTMNPETTATESTTTTTAATTTPPPSEQVTIALTTTTSAEPTTITTASTLPTTGSPPMTSAAADTITTPTTTATTTSVDAPTTTSAATTTSTGAPTTTTVASTEEEATTAEEGSTETTAASAALTNGGDGGGGSEVGALVSAFVATEDVSGEPLQRIQVARVTRLPPPSKLQAPPLPPMPRTNYLPSVRRVRKEKRIDRRSRNKRHLLGHNKDLDAGLFVALFDHHNAQQQQQQPQPLRNGALFATTAAGGVHELGNEFAIELQPHAFSSIGVSGPGGLVGGSGGGGGGGVGNVGNAGFLGGDIEVKANLNTDVISHVFYLNHQQLIHTTFKVYNAVLYFKYFEHLKMSVLELELDTPEYNLMILLPDYHVDLVAAAASLRLGPTLRMMRKQLTPKWVQAIIPDFQLHGTMFLTNDLQNMGILDIFEPNRADFHPMTNENRIYVKHIEQSINVNIRTRPINQLKRAYGTQTQPIQISVSHPFLFFVIDRELDVAVMSGRILNPQNVRIQ